MRDKIKVRRVAAIFSRGAMRVDGKRFLNAKTAAAAGGAKISDVAEEIPGSRATRFRKAKSIMEGGLENG